MDILAVTDKTNVAPTQDAPSNAAANPSASSVEARKINVVGNRIDSRELFVNTRELTISHGADVYRLRLTAQNKLILTK
jgi:hemin uptake protein HemP